MRFPMATKPGDACGAADVNGIVLADASDEFMKEHPKRELKDTVTGKDKDPVGPQSVPLCKVHFTAAEKAGFATAQLGERKDHGLVCYKRTGASARVEGPRPKA